MNQPLPYPLSDDEIGDSSADDGHGNYYDGQTDADTYDMYEKRDDDNEYWTENQEEQRRSNESYQENRDWSWRNSRGHRSLLNRNHDQHSPYQHNNMTQNYGNLNHGFSGQRNMSSKMNDDYFATSNQQQGYQGQQHYGNWSSNSQNYSHGSDQQRQSQNGEWNSYPHDQTTSPQVNNEYNQDQSAWHQPYSNHQGMGAHIGNNHDSGGSYRGMSDPYFSQNERQGLLPENSYHNGDLSTSYDSDSPTSDYYSYDDYYDESYDDNYYPNSDDYYSFNKNYPNNEAMDDGSRRTGDDFGSYWY